MKRSVLLFLALFCLIVPLAAADEAPKVITPYFEGPEYHATTAQEVIIRAGWGACNRGLAKAFTKTASISMEIEKDGQLFLVVEPPNRELWGPVTQSSYDKDTCIVNSDGLWTTEWLYSLGMLEAGTYDLHFLWVADHKLPDGADNDGDGKIDVGIYELERTITIIVE